MFVSFKLLIKIRHINKTSFFKHLYFPRNILALNMNWLKRNVDVNENESANMLLSLKLEKRSTNSVFFYIFVKAQGGFLWREKTSK